ncbi:hypothetical protein HHK36_000182 [Tetracentron sinense]|uniref:WRC domain-containing protein n=1 Tax=Tetracentron sinense TaxID=13715 RepID=A0A835A162_TETSI|nr:hypothetical protein HHK36_000182 [Tetracentron sinense]
MRIRKHAKISTLSLTHAPIDPCPLPSLQTNVCELNRSPWDVMAFVPQSDISYPEEYQARFLFVVAVRVSENPKSDQFYRVEGEDSVTVNGSVGDSIGAVESVASLKISWGEEQKEEEDGPNLLSSFVAINDAEKSGGEVWPKKEESFVCCNKTDGKGWQCRKEAKERHSLCEHHLIQLRSYHSYNYSSNKKSNKVAETTIGVHRWRRGKTLSSRNSSEFYYYSGFGPLWGKKRNGRGGEVRKREMEIDVVAQTNPSSSSHIDSHHDDYFDDESDSDSDGDGGRKRIRKPVKARSLKSLM